MNAEKYEDALSRCREKLAACVNAEPLPDAVWGHVMKLGLPYAAVTGGDDKSWQELVQEAKERLQDLRDEAAVPVAPPGRNWRGILEEVPVQLGDASRERGQALSEVAAALATFHPSVRSFRERYLGGPEETVSAAEVKETLRGYEERQRVELRNETPFGRILRTHHPHQDLRRLEETLRNQYGWREGDAKRFVLTGYVPPVDPLTVTVHGPWRWRRDAGKDYFLKTAQITIKAHVWVRADEVEQVFRNVQRQILGGDNRPSEERVLAAVRFVAQQIMEHGQERWRKRWERWNERYAPAWRYKHHRQLRQAFVRFIRPDYELPNVENALPEVTSPLIRAMEAVKESGAGRG